MSKPTRAEIDEALRNWLLAIEHSELFNVAYFRARFLELVDQLVPDEMKR